MRGSEKLILLGFCSFLGIAVCIDSINLLPGPGFITDAKLAALPHPAWATRGFEWYTREFDPMLRHNEHYHYALHVPNAPAALFYLWAIYSMLRGRVARVRPLALVWAGYMLLIVYHCLYMEVFGPTPSPRPWMCAAFYLPYALLPLSVVAVWGVPPKRD